jgi:hypothetical protein
MPSYHKKKRLAVEWAEDMKSNKLGYKLEGAERNRAKQEIRAELLDYYHAPSLDEELRWDEEVDRAFYCYSEELRFGDEYECKCRAYKH